MSLVSHSVASKHSVNVHGVNNRGGDWPGLACAFAVNQVSREEVETVSQALMVLPDPEPSVLWLESLRAAENGWKTRSE